MFGNVREVQFRSFRDWTQDALGVVTGLKILVVREPETLVLEIMRDAARPDWILVWELGRLGAEVQLRSDLGNSAHAKQDPIQALVQRVSVVAVKEQQRPALLKLSPEVPKQFNLSVRFVDPSRFFADDVWTSNVQA